MSASSLNILIAAASLIAAGCSSAPYLPLPATAENHAVYSSRCTKIATQAIKTFVPMGLFLGTAQIKTPLPLNQGVYLDCMQDAGYKQPEMAIDKY